MMAQPQATQQYMMAQPAIRLGSTASDSAVRIVSSSSNPSVSTRSLPRPRKLLGNIMSWTQHIKKTTNYIVLIEQKNHKIS
jgi:hypothetical protein